MQRRARRFVHITSCLLSMYDKGVRVYDLLSRKNVLSGGLMTDARCRPDQT